MTKKFINDISANALQVIINQLCGLLIFYLLSTFLNKNEFGEINWALAVLLTSFNVLSLGMDQLMVKKIAAGNDVGKIFSTYVTHVVIAGSGFYAVLFLSHLLFNNFFAQHQLLLLLGIAKLMLFFSTPFKQLATGLEKFRSLMLMSICSNIVRSIALIILACMNSLDMFSVVIVFIAGDAIEMMIAWLIAIRFLKVPFRIRLDRNAYKQIIRESLPQTGVVIFTAAIGRFDWILLGILASSTILAEYSFAYKVIEMVSLPLLVIAPMLIPRFTKIFQGQNQVAATKLADIQVLLRIEMIIASLVAMALIICWVPLIDWITQGKYGTVNRYTIIILSIGMPFLYLNNFLWTIHFATGALKTIFYIFLFTFLINIAGNFILIPYFKGEGAAIAYTSAVVLQAVLFLRQTIVIDIAKESFASLLIPLLGMISVLSAHLLFFQWWIILPFAILCFVLLLFLTRQTTGDQRAVFKRVTGF